MPSYSYERRVNTYKFNETLKKMPNISRQERDYLNQTFKKDLQNGLSAWELKQRINKLHYNKGDVMTPSDLNRVKNTVLKRFEK
ncbi:hypothetical protein KKE19_04430 [Patescibacteria group bacterium]|nr:hypothetical protein [Patescibacteria group bacterium]MBU4275028.1 hypothetical protein [Patescibacteria group bacterium]MBU4367598.1 hypothetical protein [Patescibacteria group bacterium]MBU4462067.1 hypothetical protein [Patescibacteria group bacterium]MCG2700453.1 hypothetical protein [Candidatus Parcubacteria bacterium]